MKKFKYFQCGKLRRIFSTFVRNSCSAVRYHEFFFCIHSRMHFLSERIVNLYSLVVKLILLTQMIVEESALEILIHGRCIVNMMAEKFYRYIVYKLHVYIFSQISLCYFALLRISTYLFYQL